MGITEEKLKTGKKSKGERKTGKKVKIGITDRTK